MTQNLERTHPVAIVALSKYSDLFEGLNNNIIEFGISNDKVLVKDGEMIENTTGWMTIPGPYEFSMAGNANLGWTSVDPCNDILYIGDDVRFTQFNTIEKLRQLAYSDEKIGMLSPRILGGADNIYQTNPPTDQGNIIYSNRYLALVCTYIKRQVIDSIGYLDAVTFNGYGWEDVDYSRRVKMAGFSLAVAPFIEVTHGVRRKGTETFLRNDKGYTKIIDDQSKRNEAAFLKKWGDNDKG